MNRSTRHHGMIRNPAFLTLLALAAGCPDDPEPAGTGPACKKGECPVDEPLPSEPTIAAPAPAPGDDAPHPEPVVLPPAPMERASSPGKRR